MNAPPVHQPPRRIETLMLSLGAERGFAEDVLGDLAEEFAIRCAWDGPRAARRWYYIEALRTAPHLLGSAIRRRRPRDLLRLLPVLLWAGMAGIAVTSALDALLPRLTMLVTGIPMNAYVNHWRTTGDLMPWLAFVLAVRRTVAPAMCGCVAAIAGKRAPLASSLAVAAAMFVANCGIALVEVPSFRKIALQVFVSSAVLCVSCIAGGIGTTLWICTPPTPPVEH